MKIARAVNWKYAVGELLIVVVGILVAVQIDGWNTDRERAAIAQTYLDRFLQDLQADTEILRKNAALSVAWAENADLLLLWMGQRNQPPPDDSVVEAVNGARGGALSRLRGSTYRDLISAGNLALFDDLDLRDAIVSYYETVPDAVVMVIESADKRTAPLYPLIGRHIDERVLYGSNRGMADHGLFVTNWRNLAGDPEVALHLRLWAAGAYDGARYFGRLAERAEAMRQTLISAGGGHSLGPPIGFQPTPLRSQLTRRVDLSGSQSTDRISATGNWRAQSGVHRVAAFDV